MPRYIWEQDRCAQNDCPNPIGTPRVTGWNLCRHASQNNGTLPHQCPRFNPAGLCSAMPPTSFCSQRCATASLEDVFQSIDKLKEGALELESRHHKALHYSWELAQNSEALKKMAAHTLARWSGDTGQPPKTVPPRKFFRRNKQRVEIAQESESGGQDVAQGETGDDDMEWQTEPPSSSSAPFGMDGYHHDDEDEYDDVDDLDEDGYG